MVGEVGDLRQMMETMKRMITRQGLEEERGVTRIQVARLEETEEKEKLERVMTTTRQKKTGMERRQQNEVRQKIGEPLYRLRESIELMGRKRIGSCWMGREYVQEHRCLQRTDIRRTRMVQ